MANHQTTIGAAIRLPYHGSRPKQLAVERGGRLRWENDLPIVFVQDKWFPLVSIDGIPIDRIMEFAQEEFGDRARKRLAEDLVELLVKMGHQPQWRVTLGLQKNDGQIEYSKIRMTEENRNLLRRQHNSHRTD